ncbi:MAG: hypothetical protein ACK4S4_07935 [Pyrinomonadaceae bacterium]
MTPTTKQLLRGGALCVAAVLSLAGFLISGPSGRMESGPASRAIVFDRYDAEFGTSKIFVTDAAGSQVVEIGSGFSPSWSPDGTKIAFADAENGGETTDIYTMNADGSGRTRVTYNYTSYAPEWSPLGDRIAFVSTHEGNSHIYIVNVDGTNQQRLALPDGEFLSEGSPVWTPDGTGIVFQGTIETPAGARDDYYRADAANSGAVQRLTYVNALFDAGKSSISPDGTKLVTRYQHSIQAFALDGSQTVTNLTAGMAEQPYDPDFAAGGTRIVFAKGDYLAVMRADGSDVVSLDVAGTRPDWNPTVVVVDPTPTPTATPTPSVDLAVHASAAPATVAVGGQTTFTVTITNPGAFVATDVHLTAPIAAGLTIGQINAGQGSCTAANGAIDCTLGAIAGNSSVTVTIAATVNAAGYIGTTFTVAAAEADPDLGNNSQAAGVTGTATTPCAPPLIEQVELRDNGHWTRDERTGIDTLRTTIRNRSGRTLDARVMFVITINTPGVTIDPSAVAGYTQCTTPNGLPYLVAYAPNKKEWKPNQDITVRIPFVNPSRGGIDWTWAWYGGSLNP